LRVKDVEGAQGIWEVTSSFSGPDERATFEYFDASADANDERGEIGIRWRRIAGHRIFKKP